MERIEIKNFAGIKEVSLEVKQINILIGPQASGKSIIAKLLFLSKNFITKIPMSIANRKSKQEFDEEFLLEFKTYFPPVFWGTQNFYIKYYINNEYISISGIKVGAKSKISEIAVECSNFYQKSYASGKNNFDEAYKDYEDREARMSTARFMTLASFLEHSFLEHVHLKLNRTAIFHQLYIPAGRAFFASIKNISFKLLSEANTILPVLASFGIYYEDIKNIISLELTNTELLSNKLHKEIGELNEKILCGKYFQKEGEDYIKVGDRQIAIANSSSGQQETLPLLLILTAIALDKSRYKENSIYIEEPEAHIFPAAQKSIVELISTVYNARKDSLQFVITTHSPYILTAFNNLLQAGILAIDATEDKIDQISRHVPRSRFLTPQEVAVYSLENGYCKSIIDEETGLIDTNIIDEVSNDLAIEFDELLELEE